MPTSLKTQQTHRMRLRFLGVKVIVVHAPSIASFCRAHAQTPQLSSTIALMHVLHRPIEFADCSSKTGLDQVNQQHQSINSTLPLQPFAVLHIPLGPVEIAQI